jgi:hypothetical protein
VKVDVAICLITMTLLPGCNYILKTESTLPKTSYVQDSWYNALPKGLRAWTWDQLSATDVYEVSSLMQPRTEIMLKRDAAIQLSGTQLQSFTGKSLSRFGTHGKKAFLVRALYMNKMPKGYIVHSNGTQLWVHHEARGTMSRPMKRQALIVFLQSPPTQVFVTCSMSE